MTSEGAVLGRPSLLGVAFWIIMAIAVNEQENPRENLIDEMEELVEEHFTNAPFNVKLVYFNNCKDVLSNFILLESNMVGTSHEEYGFICMISFYLIWQCSVRTVQRRLAEIRMSKWLQFKECNLIVVAESLKEYLVILAKLFKGEELEGHFTESIIWDHRED
uniref:Uncharacterized protein n=1 Tax=Amphimedon queenslandica TaxID=400682 RepID=A0A1X7VGU2_AMPQE